MQDRTRIEPNEHTRTYATVERLDKALQERGFSELRHVLCYTKDGRVTAVFIDRQAVERQVFHQGFIVAF